MNISVGSPLLTLAICFSVIELSSQAFNRNAVREGSLNLPDDQAIYYNTNIGSMIISLLDGADTPGLVTSDGNIMVAAIEYFDGKKIPRHLEVDGGKVVSTTSRPFKWTAEHEELFAIDFDEPI